MYECVQQDGDISQGNRFQVSFLVINIKRTDCTQSNNYEQNEQNDYSTIMNKK